MLFGRCNDSNCFYHKTKFPVPIGFSKCILCNGPISLEGFDSSWLTILGENADLWINVDRIPSVIAYEYNQLRKMACNNQLYGFLLCLRDNYEILLKFETLISFAWANQQSTDEFRKHTIGLITTSNPTLGVWIELARRLVLDLKEQLNIKLPSEIPLELIREKYIESNIVQWRNERVGHGALEINNNELLQNECINLFSIYSDLLAEISDSLTKQQLYVDDLLLAGPNFARGLPKEEKIICTLYNTQTSFPLYPFIIIRKHEKRGYGIYFFDNQRSRLLTAFQAYAEGSWSKEEISFFSNLRLSLERNSMDLSVSPQSPYLTQTESEEIESLQMEHNFLRPEYIISWLKDVTSKHECGIFMLKMEQGTGKSIFTSKLDRFFDKAVLIDKSIDVRTYHFTRIQTAGDEDLRSRIEWLWSNDRNNTSWQNIPRIRDIESTGKNLANALCDFMKEVQAYSIRNRGTRRLLMVFDGIDEINKDEFLSLFPDPSLLPKGIYILLTSRIPGTDEMTEKTASQINNITVTEDVEIYRTSKEYQDFLNQYLVTSLGNAKIRTIEKEIPNLINKADNRIQLLSLFCKLICNGMSATEILSSDSFLKSHIEYLSNRYGEQATIRLKEILSVLSIMTPFEPLTLAEIGLLTVEGKVTLKLLGMLRDISTLLIVNRNSSENKYAINPILVNELRDQLPELHDTLRDIIDITISLMDSNISINNTEIEVTAVHIAELAEILFGDKVTTFMDSHIDCILDYFDMLIEAKHNTINIVSQLRRMASLSSSKKHLMRITNLIDKATSESNSTFVQNNNEPNTALYCNTPLLEEFIEQEITLKDGKKCIVKIKQRDLDMQILILQFKKSNELLERGDEINAILQLNYTLTKLEEIYGKNDEISKSAHFYLSEILCATDRYEEALKEKEYIIEYCKTLFKDYHHSGFLKQLGWKAYLLYQLHRFTESEMQYREILKLQLESNDSSKTDIRKTILSLKDVLFAMDRNEDAIVLERKYAKYLSD